MTNEELAERVKALEQIQNIMFLILVKTSSHPELVVEVLKQITAETGGYGEALSALAKEQLISLAASFENIVKNDGGII